MNGIEKHLYDKGRNDGLEEAAKIAEKWVRAEPTPPNERDGPGVGEMIRDLKDKAAGKVADK